MRLTKITLFVLLLSAAVFGQTNRGAISGTVTDLKGGVIPGATVTVTNEGTNQQQTLTTSSEGAFTANSLEPVKYTVAVESPNFKTSIVPGVKVDTATTQTVNVVLETGSISEKVTITADTPLLNTESGTTSKTITERQLEDVPLNNRSVLDLATTIPNVSGDVGSEDPEVTSAAPVPGFNLSINGGRPGSTAILSDGVNNTGVGIARQVVSFTPETVQEFTVQTSAYSAEYGNTAGGVINATTKAGTNSLTGTALWYHRNPATNARKWGNGAVRPDNNLRTNQVSFTVGGPVFLPHFGEGGPTVYNGKNRTFFFFAVEPRWRKDFLVVDTLLPTAAERAGDFRNLVRTSSGWLPASVAAQYNLTSVGPTAIYRQFNLVGNQLQRLAVPATGLRYCQFGETSTLANNPNYCSATVATSDALNVVPQGFIDPTSLKVLQFMPNPGGYYLNGGGGFSNYQVNRFVVQNEIRYTGRIDHNITKNNHANFRFTIVPAIGSKGFGSDINGNGASYSNSKQYVATDSHIFTPALINEVRLGFTTGTFSDDFTKEYSINGGKNLASDLGLPSITEGGLPLFMLNGESNGYNAFASIGSSGSTNNFNKEKRYTLTDIVYWTQGNKSWKFGVDLGDAKLNVIPFAFASGGRYDFRSGQTSNNQAAALSNGGNLFASFLIGSANAVAVRSLLIPYNYDWKSVAAFVQNDWKIRPNLTLNLGFRYSLQLPRTEKNNLQGTYMPELAKEFTLPTPVTLPTQRVVTSALVPPFAFAGRGGRSKYIFPIDYNGFEPRFGFAWSPKSILGWGKEGETVIRGGYGISHAPLTGNNRLPNPDLGSFNVNSATDTATGSNGATNSAYALRLSSNQPINGQSLLNATPSQIQQALGIPEDGLIYLGSLAIPAYTIAGKPKTPYVQNWNLSISHQILKNTVVEIAYVGNKGTHLFLPLVNVNPRDFNYIQQLDLLGTGTETNTADPLNRRSLIGSAITISSASLGSRYLGFDTLNSFYDTSANSIRHAGYIDIRRRITSGFAFTANYTYGKSLDDASDASPDKNILTSGNTQGSNVSFNAPRYTDRAISTFDVKHAFSSTFIWDLPVGRKRMFFSKVWSPVDAVIGGWTMSGVMRVSSGYPFLPTIADANTLGTLTHSVRPDIVPGVALVNPRYSPSCKVSSLCEPYINPAAFMRPAKGSLGNAPRTLDVRGPWQRYFDVSFQKNFNMPFGWDKEGRRRFQLRVDLINAFNMPNFRISSPGSGAGPDYDTAPVETPITLAEYNSWAAFNGKPAAATTADPAFQQVLNLRPAGVLPLNFYTIPVPEGFATTNPNAYDITTLNGYKLYRLKNAYGANGSGFGQLRELGQPRYIQFGLKIYF